MDALPAAGECTIVSRIRGNQMKRLLELSGAEARKHFLKASSYFKDDLPSYLSFEPILTSVDAALNGATYATVQADCPSDFPGSDPWLTRWSLVMSYKPMWSTVTARSI